MANKKVNKILDFFPNTAGKSYTKLFPKEYGEIALKLMKTGLIILKKSSGELRKKWFNSGCPLWYGIFL
jgi:hypothetical protein